jgi:predicted nucleotidyltransferase
MIRFKDFIKEMADEICKFDNYLFRENFINEVEIHNTLNDKIWEGSKLKPEVYKALKGISDNFIEFLGIDKDLVKNIIFTGSNANFNYHSGSDIDIHIELDTSNFKCLDIDDFLKTKKTLWNEQHNITIYGYDVELYAESSKDHPVTNAGVYSIKQNKWIIQPTKISIDNIDEKAVKLKANVIKHQIDNIIKNKVDDVNSIKKVKNIIKNMRVEGINTNGEYSIENLSFKVLRDEGYLEKLSNYNNNLIDNNLSLK